MANAIRYVKALGIHERFDLELEFQSGVNILYGKNGTGKTTLLHILANILNGDFERFAFIPFETIEVHLDNGQKVKLLEYKHDEGNKVEVDIDGTEVTSFATKEVREKLRYRSSGPRSEPQHNIRLFHSLKAILPTAYFPAFRTLIEASSKEDYFIDAYHYSYTAATPYSNRTVSDIPTVHSTLFARKFFGDFVPWLNYPSPEEVSQRLSMEMQQALNIVANTDRKLLSKAFLDIFRTLSEESNPTQEQPEHILEKIKSLFSRLESSSIVADLSSGEEVYTKLRELVPSFKIRPENEDVYVPIMKVYKNSLEERADVQENSLRIINTYLDSVNRFLDGKGLVFGNTATTQVPPVWVKFHETGLESKIQALSSGERQIVTLIYSATHMSGQKVVLIDEPEISLHIDWQSLLIPEMVAQLQDRQIITCTHSPMIGAEYEDQMIQLDTKPTHKRLRLSADNVDDIEEDL
jgi:energy-coupling factor transporter ATP-binding protein EcfA2